MCVADGHSYRGIIKHVLKGLSLDLNSVCRLDVVLRNLNRRKWFIPVFITKTIANLKKLYGSFVILTLHWPYLFCSLDDYKFWNSKKKIWLWIFSFWLVRKRPTYQVNILTNILSPLAQVFLLDELKACLQLGSLEKWPSTSRPVPITNMPQTTPMIVNSINHNLKKK